MSSTRATAFTRTTSAIGASLAVATDPDLLGSASEQQRRQLTILLRNALDKLSPPAPVVDATTLSLAAWEVDTFGAAVTGTELEQETPPEPRFAVRELADGRFSVTRDGAVECSHPYPDLADAEGHVAYLTDRGAGPRCDWRPLSPGKVEPVRARFEAAPHPSEHGTFTVLDHVEKTADWFTWSKEVTAADAASEWNAAGRDTGASENSPSWSAEVYALATEPEPEDLTARYDVLLTKDGRTGIVDRTEGRFANFWGGSIGYVRRTLARAHAGELEAGTMRFSWTDGIPEPRFEAVELPGGGSTILDHVAKRTRESDVSIASNLWRAETMNTGAIEPGRIEWRSTSAEYDRATRPRFEIVRLPNGVVGIADHARRQVAGFAWSVDPERAYAGKSLRDYVADFNAGQERRFIFDGASYSDDLTVVPAP